MTFDKGAFFTTLRNRVGGLSGAQVTGIEAILDAMAKEQFPLSWAAYTLATPWWETKRTMEPVEEAYWIKNAAEWRKQHLRYWPWHGRGLVQITWKPNYEHADAECAKAGLIKAGEIIANPELVMRLDIAVFILVRGMKEGWFTGAKLRSMLPAQGTATRLQYMEARTIINGRDRADDVEDGAQIFERALRDGGWA